MQRVVPAVGGPIALLLALLTASPVPASAAPAKLTLEQVIARAIAGPRAQMSHADRDAASARVDEADAARLPRVKATVLGTLSPKITCDDPDCLSTSPQNFAFRFSGLFGSAQLDVTQPLYTFGKIDHARKASRAGLAAQVALADEAAGDLAVDAARAYWGVKVARELGLMLDDGIDEIARARERLDEREGVSIEDRQRVALLAAEAKLQRAEAMQAESQALAGLRALVGDPAAELDDTELAPVEREIPHEISGDARPQAIAARAGARAASELAAFQASHYWPDVALVGSAGLARAQGVDDPPSVFANDPYNRSGVGLVLALQWSIEPWNVHARTARARAEARKAQAQADLARIGASYDGQLALSEATSARAKLDATTEGAKAARAWLSSVLQSDAIGVAEPKQLADAYIAWFQMRARHVAAVFQWNVAAARIDRAAGRFHAPR
ncbi:MAG: TolC family protein [Kofleriaceae bacterium]